MVLCRTAGVEDNDDGKKDGAYYSGNKGMPPCLEILLEMGESHILRPTIRDSPSQWWLERHRGYSSLARKMSSNNM